MGLGIGTGDCDWGLVVTFGWDRGGIGDWDWELGIGIGDWDWGLGFGIGFDFWF